jgi:hypothetical protein
MLWQKLGEAFKREKNKTVTKINGALVGYMIGRYDISLDDLQDLRRVEYELILGNKPMRIMMFRIFNPNTAKERKVTIDSYSSLDNHPELILYEGHYRDVDGEAMDINIEKKRG